MSWDEAFANRYDEWVGMLDADFDVSGCPELADELRKLSARYARAV